MLFATLLVNFYWCMWKECLAIFSISLLHFKERRWKHEGTKDVREALVVIAFHSRLDFALAGARYTTFWNWVSEEFGRRRRARARSSWSMALCSISSCSARERHGGKSNGEETAQKYIINMWNGCDLSLNLSPPLPYCATRREVNGGVAFYRKSTVLQPWMQH